MPITRRVTVHEGPGGTFESLAVFDSSTERPRPGILLFPNVLGTKEADFAYAEKVAALGHTVLVADLYGQGKRTTRADADMGRYMAELNADRAVLRDRGSMACACCRCVSADSQLPRLCSTCASAVSTSALRGSRASAWSSSPLARAGSAVT